MQTMLGEKQKELDGLEEVFTKDELTDQEFSARRQDIKRLQETFQALKDEVSPVYDLAKAEMDDLGPPPQVVDGAEVVPEPESIVALRQSLQDRISILDGILVQIEASQAKSTRSLERLAALRRTRFLGRIMEKHVTPFNAQLWRDAFETRESLAAAALTDLKNVFVRDGILRKNLVVSFIAFSLIFVSACFLSRRSLRRRIADCQSDAREMLFYHVSVSILVPVVAGIIGLVIVYQSLQYQGAITEVNGRLIHIAFAQAAFLIFVSVMTRRLVFARLIRRKIRWLYLSAAVLYAVDALLSEAGHSMNAPLELTLVHIYIVTSVFAALLMLFSLSILKKEQLRAALEQAETGDGAEKPARFWMPRQLFFVFMAAGVFIISANLLGYAALAHYIFDLFIKGFTFGAFLLILRALVRPSISRLDALWQPHKDDTHENEERLLYFWLCLSFDLFLVFFSLPVWAGILGFAWEDIKDSAVRAFFGFKIGEFTLSFANMAIAVVAFLVLLFLTRLVQQVLGKKILPKTHMEGAVQQSLVQITGYIGLSVAFMAAISAVGVDMSNIALIAGALSVGIGFGLQSIVSNFVSGLILLFERPIKVGDWVIVDSGQGVVKKISVRATEIETFDRTSIIVPNSELISSSVKNWTYKDMIGRAIIPIGVSYDSDPRLVYDLLLACAQNHPGVVRYPEPTVVFKDFGDSALLFELRVFLRNIRDVFDVCNGIRFEIWDKFKEHHIEIPFPQSDIHIRSAKGLDGMRSKAPKA